MSYTWITYTSLSFYDIEVLALYIKVIEKITVNNGFISTHILIDIQTSIAD